MHWLNNNKLTSIDSIHNILNVLNECVNYCLIFTSHNFLWNGLQMSGHRLSDNLLFNRVDSFITVVTRIDYEWYVETGWNGNETSRVNVNRIRNFIHKNWIVSNGSR